MKTRLKKDTRQLDTRSANQRRHSSGAEFVDKRSSSAVQNRVMQGIDNSPVMTLQRKQLERSTGSPVQKIEEDELLQGKFNTLQRQEEDELLQGRFETLQRQEDLEEEELIQGKFESVQRQGIEDEELLQGKFTTAQRQGPEEEELLQGKFSQSLQREQDKASVSNKTGMPDHLKNGIESLSGMDVSDVRVHYNSSRPAQLNALAYAQGSDIHLASGQEKHLPHEAWHTVQQRQGRVQPTMQMAGTQINDDAGLEKEADVMGEKAAKYKK
jgi:hypothetical protein